MKTYAPYTIFLRKSQAFLSKKEKTLDKNRVLLSAGVFNTMNKTEKDNGLAPLLQSAGSQCACVL